jgi:hypothetical protein
VLTDDDLAALVRQAYEREYPTLSYDKVLARAGGSRLRIHSNRWLPIAVALVLVAALTTIGIVVRLAEPHRSVPIGPPSPSPVDTRLASECAAQFGAGLPPLQFSFADGDRALQAYVDDHALVVCLRTSAGATARVLARSYQDSPWLSQLTADRLGYVLFRDASGIELILGTAPAGTDRVTAQIANGGGPDRPATLHNGYFAIWAPHAGLDLAEVVAEGGGADIAAGPPTAFMGDLDQDDLAAAFQSSALATLTAAAVDPQRAGNLTAHPNQVFGSGIDTVALYGDATALVGCRLVSFPDDGLPAVDCHTTNVAPSQQPLAPLTFISGQTESDSYVLGVLPPGAVRVTVTTGSIAEIRADIHGGLFSAYWKPLDRSDQQRLTIKAFDKRGNVILSGGTPS